VSEEEDLFAGIEVGSAQSQTIMERLAGFNGYWNRNAPDRWKVVEEISSNGGDIVKAQEDVERYMDAYPDLGALVGLNNGSTIGIVNAVYERGRKDLTVIGFDYSDEMAAMIADPDMDASAVVQKQYDMGWKAVETACDIAQGLLPSGRYTDTGVELVTKDNVNDPEIQSVLKR
jgi:ribose transport system substrate-binding protein